MSVTHAAAPLYEASMAALESAIAEAETIMAALDQLDPDSALRLCAQTVHAFAAAETGLRAMRERAETRGLRLFREMRKGRAA